MSSSMHHHAHGGHHYHAPQAQYGVSTQYNKPPRGGGFSHQHYQSQHRGYNNLDQHHKMNSWMNNNHHPSGLASQQHPPGAHPQHVQKNSNSSSASTASSATSQHPVHHGSFSQQQTTSTLQQQGHHHSTTQQQQQASLNPNPKFEANDLGIYSRNAGLKLQKAQGEEAFMACDPSDEEEAHKLLLALDLEEVCKGIKFRFESSISNTYDLGNEVVPTENGRNQVKSVTFAKRRADGRSVVIKMRNKQKSFKDEQEIRDWMANMRLLFQMSGGPPMLQDFRKESTAYPHVAKVLDIVEDDDSYFVVMEHVKGRDLFDYFVQDKIYEKPYKIHVAKQIARELVMGMDEMHSHGLVHKDIKLENIVLDESRVKQQGQELICTCKVVDFDTVEIYRPGTKSFHVLGTDQYIAPETYVGYATPTADMWAIGVIFFTILTGSFPFHCALFDDQPGENYVGHARMDQIRRRLRIARIDWSNKVWAAEPLAKDFVRRCFDTDPKKRLTCKEALAHPWIRDVKVNIV
ncbi:unnamed protein product [Amoebophrya sp. A25]|nr:unnamed protein product [Amoebophrya sp. A25]|eukprot:GSA25T00005546001.1